MPVTETICSTNRLAVPKPDNLSRVIGMVLGGDLHDAAVLLAQGGMMKSFSGRCVARWLMGRLLRRSRMHLNQTNITAALDAIDDAKMVAGPAGQRWVAVRLAGCLENTLRQCKRLMNAGNFRPLIEILDELGRRGLHCQETEQLLELARIAHLSDAHAREEQWAASIEYLEKLREHSQRIPWFSPRMKWLRDRLKTRNLNETRSEFLSTTIKILDSSAPRTSTTNKESMQGSVQLRLLGQALNGSPFPKRLLLWIDGIGHYLLCLEPEIWIGRYVPLSGIQVPIHADIGRRHVRLIRDESGAVNIQAHWPTCLVSKSSQVQPDEEFQIQRLSLDARTETVPVLESNLKLELGERVVLEYQKPAIDRPVTIRSLSGHRTVPAANAIVWMDRRLTIGGNASFDIHCRNRTGQLVIEFGEDGVFVTGADCVSMPAETETLTPGRAGVRISAADISLVLEPLESGQEIPFAGSLQPKTFQTKSGSGKRGSFRIE